MGSNPTLSATFGTGGTEPELSRELMSLCTGRDACSESFLQHPVVPNQGSLMGAFSHPLHRCPMPEFKSFAATVAAAVSSFPERVFYVTVPERCGYCNETGEKQQ